MSRIMVVVEFELKPEHRSQFIELINGHAQRSRAEDGCQQFDMLLPQEVSGVQIEPKMVQNPYFPVVLGCAARQSRRTAKSGIKKNQWVSISMRNRARKLADLLAFPSRATCARCKNSPLHFSHSIHSVAKP
jgi:hypothetical protein